MRFSRLVPWKHESIGRVLSGHQLGKPSDVRWIMSTHEGSFVFIIHPTRGILSFIAYYNYQDQTLYNICDYCWHCCNSLCLQYSRSFLMFKVNFQLVKSKGGVKPDFSSVVNRFCVFATYSHEQIRVDTLIFYYILSINSSFFTLLPITIKWINLRIENRLYLYTKLPLI